MLIDVLDFHLSICKNILSEIKDYLNLSFESSIHFTKDQLNDENMSKKGYQVDLASIKLLLENWKGLRALIDKYGKILPPKKMIVPTGISY